MKAVFYLLIVAAMLLTGARTARARLGETPVQCEARYGQPSTGYNNGDLPGEKRALYHKNGIEIFVSFFQGRAVKISFSKPASAHPEFSKEEIQKLLEANNSGSSWSAPKANDGWTDWTRADGATATYDDTLRTLLIRTRAYLDAEAAGKNPGQKGSMVDGF